MWQLPTSSGLSLNSNSKRTCVVSNRLSKRVKPQQRIIRRFRREYPAEQGQGRTMKAVCWYGKGDVRVETVPEPKILNPRDAIIKVTLSAICGSDVHLYNGCIPTMHEGDILGHECMGEVVEVGSAVHNLRPGDRVVVPFTIACGQCFCQRELWSLCDNSNPNACMAEKVYGYSGSGLFGYSHMYGGMPADRRNTSAYPLPTWAPSKYHTASTTSRSCFCPISSPPVIWLPRTAASSGVIL